MRNNYDILKVLSEVTTGPTISLAMSVAVAFDRDESTIWHKLTDGYKLKTYVIFSCMLIFNL